jgi:hypothetical protein
VRLRNAIRRLSWPNPASRSRLACPALVPSSEPVWTSLKSFRNAPAADSGDAGRSELDLQCELDDPRVCRTDDLSEPAADHDSRHTQVGMVQGVEKLRAELYQHPLEYGEAVLSEYEVSRR